MARVDLLEPPTFPAWSDVPTYEGPDRRRLLWAAMTGSGMLSGIYWTFPPIFADAEPTAFRVIGSEPLLGTASLDASATAAPVFPDIPLTPAIRVHRESIAMLEEGLRRLKAVPGYTAEFSKQEVVGGALTAPQRMQVKLRHAPFSVYMKWIEGRPGQELLYVEGQNDGEMIVKAGGWKGRLLGAIKIDPHGTLALSESRHPVTHAGLARLAEKVLTFRYREVGLTSGYDCIHDQAEVDGRPCHRFAIIYDDPSVRAEYRKSVIYVDREWLVITQVENYAWPAEGVAADRLDEETLVERYSYTNINLDTQLAAVDFDVANAEYGLKRR